MRPLRLSLALLAFAACGASTTVPDAAATAAQGCRFPRACFATACACTFGPDGTTLAECKRCDPVTTGADCVCANFSDADAGDVECLEQEQVCVGRGPACEGGFCVRVGMTCDDADAGDEPQTVADDDTDAGPSLAAHCPFTDDVCCPRAPTALPDAAAATD
jgi:hypothetical protein